MLVRPELNSRPPASQPSAQQLSHRCAVNNHQHFPADECCYPCYHKFFICLGGDFPVCALSSLLLELHFLYFNIFRILLSFQSFCLLFTINSCRQRCFQNWAYIPTLSATMTVLKSMAHWWLKWSMQMEGVSHSTFHAFCCVLFSSIHFYHFLIRSLKLKWCQIYCARQCS